MDRPAWGDHGLFVPDHDVPRLLRRAHEVEDQRIGGQVEIEVDFLFYPPFLKSIDVIVVPLLGLIPNLTLPHLIMYCLETSRNLLA